jgi:hypothetical protein
MLRRHSDIIENALDDLSIGPVAVLSRQHLRLAYGAERLNKNAFRDLFDRIPENIDLGDLSIIEAGNTLYIVKTEDMIAANTKI